MVRLQDASRVTRTTSPHLNLCLGKRQDCLSHILGGVDRSQRNRPVRLPAASELNFLVDLIKMHCARGSQSVASVVSNTDGSHGGILSDTDMIARQGRAGVRDERNA